MFGLIVRAVCGDNDWSNPGVAWAFRERGMMPLCNPSCSADQVDQRRL